MFTEVRNRKREWILAKSVYIALPILSILAMWQSGNLAGRVAFWLIGRDKYALI